MDPIVPFPLISSPFRFIARLPDPDRGSAVPVSKNSLLPDDDPLKGKENLFEMPDFKLSTIVTEVFVQIFDV